MPVDARHHEVEDHQVVGPRQRQREALVPGASLVDLQALGFETAADEVHDPLLVIHEQHPAGQRRLGLGYSSRWVHGPPSGPSVARSTQPG